MGRDAMVGCKLDGIMQEALVFMVRGTPIILGYPMVR